ncbi:DUF2785 domain-containing protein [Sporosarcina sp. FA9]|uniref:DUF2785 domain-containing protein n=1 Tax=Sporosarcina sp. FA9 TaxID=3413030 RepID=UPI003F65C847
MLKTTLESYLDDVLLELSPEIRHEMLVQIGNPESYLRDKLIYGSFMKMIYSNQLNKVEIQGVLEEVVKTDYLLYRIGELGTDSVFTRSFSALVVAAIIEYDVEKQVLDSDIVLSTVNSVIQYMMEEQDTRGFIDEKGWAHAIAHGADALDALAKHPQLKIEDINQILHVLEKSLLRQVDYLDEEEERLASVIASLIGHQNVELEIQLWLENLTTLVERLLDENKGSIVFFHIQRNVKNFLKSVNIILKSKKIGRKVNNDVFEILEKWMYLR